MLATSFAFMEARGPYWLGSNFDPSYAYLLNSLRVAELRAPFLVEHPGTPVELLGALAVRAVHAASRPGTPLEQHVIDDPESCIRVTVALLLVLYGGALTLAGRAMLRATHSAALAWLVQATPFFSHSLLLDLADLKPEPLLCTLAALFAAILIPTLGDSPPRGSRWILVLAVLTGAAAATKYTAVSLCGAALLLVPGIRGKARFAGVAALSFLVSVSPALFTFSRSVRFIWRLATGTGLYGLGLFPEHTNYLFRLGVVAREEVIFFLALLASGGVAMATALQGRRLALAPERRATLRALLAVLAVDTLQIALLLKQPYQARYLLPALGLVGLNLALAARLLCWDDTHRLRRVPALAALVFVTAAACLQTWRISTHLVALRGAAACQRRARRVALSNPQCVRALYYRSSSPAMALRAGDLNTGGVYRRAIEAHYPGALFLEDFLRDNYPKLTSGSAVAAAEGCFVFQGSPGGPANPFSDLSAFDPAALPVEGQVKILFACGMEAVFRVDHASAASPPPARSLTAPAPAPRLVAP